MCKFKIDKIIYSKRMLEQHMTLAKISLYRILMQININQMLDKSK